jgi:uncharacterized protein YegP (UPF0339 family)
MQFRIYQDLQYDWRWQLSDEEGRKLAESSQSYREKADCLYAIIQVQRCEHAVVLENASTLMEVEMQAMPGLMRRH